MPQTIYNIIEGPNAKHLQTYGSFGKMLAHIESLRTYCEEGDNIYVVEQGPTYKTKATLFDALRLKHGFEDKHTQYVFVGNLNDIGDYSIQEEIDEGRVMAIRETTLIN